MSKSSAVVIIFIVIGVLVIVGGVYWWQKSIIEEERVSSPITKPTETATPKPTTEKIDVPTEAPEGPLDTALAAITILSVQDEMADIRIEEIRDYHRYPGATYSQLKVGDEISVRIYYVAPETPTGTGVEAVKEGEPPSITPQPKPITGKKYLASMSICFTEYIGGLSCKYEGWSTAIYPITPLPVTP